MKTFNLPTYENSSYKILSVWEAGTIPFCIVCIRTHSTWTGKMVIRSKGGLWVIDSPRVSQDAKGKTFLRGITQTLSRRATGIVYYSVDGWVKPKSLVAISDAWWALMIAEVQNNRPAWS